MKPQTKNVTMCPPRTCDHAIHPPFGAGSIEETWLISKVDVGTVFFSAMGSGSWSSTVSIDRYVFCCSIKMKYEVRNEATVMSVAKFKGFRRRFSHHRRKNAASGIASYSLRNCRSPVRSDSENFDLKTPSEHRQSPHQSLKQSGKVRIRHVGSLPSQLLRVSRRAATRARHCTFAF